MGYPYPYPDGYPNSPPPFPAPNSSNSSSSSGFNYRKPEAVEGTGGVVVGGLAEYKALHVGSGIRDGRRLGVVLSPPPGNNAPTRTGSKVAA